MAHRRLLPRVRSSNPRAGPRQRARPTAQPLPEGARRRGSKIRSFVPNGVVHSGKEAMGAREGEEQRRLLPSAAAAAILLTAAAAAVPRRIGRTKRREIS